MIYLFKYIVIFHSYVRLPEGIWGLCGDYIGIKNTSDICRIVNVTYYTPLCRKLRMCKGFSNNTGLEVKTPATWITPKLIAAWWHEPWGMADYTCSKRIVLVKSWWCEIWYFNDIISAKYHEIWSVYSIHSILTIQGLYLSSYLDLFTSPKLCSSSDHDSRDATDRHQSIEEIHPFLTKGRHIIKVLNHAPAWMCCFFFGRFLLKRNPNLHDSWKPPTLFCNHNSSCKLQASIFFLTHPKTYSDITNNHI